MRDKAVLEFCNEFDLLSDEERGIYKVDNTT